MPGVAGRSGAPGKPKSPEHGAKIAAALRRRKERTEKMEIILAIIKPMLEERATLGSDTARYALARMEELDARPTS